jgi:putative peptidoglycan lipid II flippase
VADISKGVRAFTLGTAISRVMGLVRESVFAYLFGAGRSTDAFNAAFRIPNLLRDLFAETTLSSAFVPVLSEQRARGKEAENLTASNVFNILLICVGVIVLLGIVLAPFLTRILAFGFGNIPNKIALTTGLTAVMFPFLLFIALAAWAMGYLNTENEFFVPSLAPALFNLFSIGLPILLFAYLSRRGIDPILGMALGVVLGGLMQFLIQIPILYKKGFRYRFYINLRDPYFKKILALFLPVAMGLAASRINVAVDMVLISLLEERSMTWLNYAFRIMHLPLGLFGIAVGTVALPTIARLVINDKLPEVRATLFDSLKMVFMLTVSTSIIIAFLSQPITQLIYERGRFTAFDTQATTQALIYYIIGIPFMAGLRNITAVFYAYKDARTPMYASFAAVVIHIIISVALMSVIGFRAFPIATTFASFVNCLILLYVLPSKIGRFDPRPLLKYFLLLVFAACLAGLGGRFLYNILSGVLLMGGIIGPLINILISGTLSIALFYAVCRLVGLKEVDDYLRRLLRK